MALKNVDYVIDAPMARAGGATEPEGLVRFAALATLFFAEGVDPQFRAGLMRASSVRIVIEFFDPQEELPL